MSATGEAGDAGATLLEVLVVLAIAGMTAGLVFPAMHRTLDVLALRQSASVLAANLRTARGQALRSGRTTPFGVAADGSAYGWSGGAERNLPRGQRVTLAEVDRVLFYGDGTANGGAVTIAGGGRRIAIGIDPATGAVVIVR